ncbi:MAG: SRPBCC domain-containing protein, partial [Spirosomaceae bacterium]|nr:SRPBCC domain-containing protein [Spirosomataceae bacterium]
MFQALILLKTLSKMIAPLIVKNEIVINANAAKVWDALVNPAQTKKYMFGCETVSDWQVGSKLDWRGNYEGQEMVFVTGRIINIISERLLAYTTFDPNGMIEDILENHTTVTYSLESAENLTLLRVTQGDFSTVADGQRRFEEVYNNGEGWQPILA